MIAFLKGSLYSVQADAVVLDVNGVGYRVYVPVGVVQRLPQIGAGVVLYTHMQSREDGISLFGFDTEEALEMFRLLLGVSGVGPKGALGILSAITPENFSAAVMTDNIAAITRAPGVGKKTAQRIILELKDRMKKFKPASWPESYVPADTGEAADAVEALVGLGYTPAEALRAVHEASKEADADGGLPDLIKMSLRRLSAAKAYI